MKMVIERKSRCTSASRARERHQSSRTRGDAACVTFIAKCQFGPSSSSSLAALPHRAVASSTRRACAWIPHGRLRVRRQRASHSLAVHAVPARCRLRSQHHYAAQPLPTTRWPTLQKLWRSSLSSSPLLQRAVRPTSICVLLWLSTASTLSSGRPRRRPTGYFSLGAQGL